MVVRRAAAVMSGVRVGRAVTRCGDDPRIARAGVMQDVTVNVGEHRRGCIAGDREPREQ